MLHQIVRHRKKLTMKQQAECDKLVGANIHRHPTTDGLYEYGLGWDDKRVADELHLSIDAVKRRRLGVFGPIMHARPVGSLDEVYARLTKLEERVKLLEDVLK